MSEEKARKLNGILIYASAAFEWDPSDNTWWARMVVPISGSYKGGQFMWCDTCKDSVEQLLSRLEVAPRVACNPRYLMMNGWRIVIKSDW